MVSIENCLLWGNTIIICTAYVVPSRISNYNRCTLGLYSCIIATCTYLPPAPTMRIILYIHKHNTDGIITNPHITSVYLGLSIHDTNLGVHYYHNAQHSSTNPGKECWKLLHVLLF